MLHRNFKPAKCKTSLKLATSRIKLMKNKKGVQINQIKRELAQLLESGQDRTARIRVEHVIREEKMVAAYDLVEIYCELIAARLPIVESQKNCPIDLKEAITSVIFASPRCADITELLDIRKQFTAKYGKEFISAAIELRPDCGVSRMLIEKLSAVAPDLQTKIKVLSAVAKEHDIKWDPNSFEENESKPPNDLLNGPNTFEKASNMHADPPKFQAPNVQPVHGHEEKHDGSFDLSQQNRRSSVGSQNFASTGSGGIGTSSTTYTDVRSSAARVPDRMEVRQSFPRDGSDFSSGGQNWNMEFKDATSAAQAAAESAERASMAARAAAELSRQHSTESQRSNIRDEGPRDSRQYSTAAQRSNIRDEGPRDSRQHSTASQRSNIRDEGPRDSRQHSTASQRSNIRDEGPRDARQYSNASQRSNIRDEGPRDATSEYPGERRSRDSYNSSFNDRKPNVQNQQTDGSDHDTSQKAAESFYEYCRSASLRSNIGSADDEEVTNRFQRAEVIKEEEGPFSPEMSMKKKIRGSKIESVKSGQKDGITYENFNHFGEEVIRKQASTSSSRSHSSTFSDEYDVSTSDQLKFGKSTVPDPFVSVDQGNIFRETKKTSSVTFDDDDEADSDDDVPRFDMGPEYDEGEAKSYFPSPGRESSTRPLENTNIWSPRSNRSNAVEKSSSQTFLSPERHSFSEYSAKSVDSLERDNHSPVAFDHSDGPDSESEVELEKSTLSRTKQFTSFPHKRDLYSTDPEPMQFDSHDLRGSSLPEKGKLGSDIAAQSHSSSDYTKLESSNKFNSGKSRIELNDLVESESSFYKSQQSSRLPLRNEFKDTVMATQSPDTLEDNEFLNQPNNSDSGKELNFGTLTGGLRNKASHRHPPYTRVSAGNASSSSSKKTVDERSTTATSSFNLRVSRIENKKPSVSNSSSDSSSDDSTEKFMQKASKQVNTRSKFEPPVSFLNDDASDSEEDVPKQTSSRVRLGGFSQRTKSSASSSKARVESEAKIVNTASDVDKKASKHSYSDETETPPKPQSHTGRFNKEASKPIPDAKVSSMREETRKSQAESSSFKQEGQAHSGSLKQEGRAHLGSLKQEGRAHSGSLKQGAFNSKPLPESKISIREENLKSQSVEQPANNRPSHVHPKLPDYDSIAARLQALRSNHH